MMALLSPPAFDDADLADVVLAGVGDRLAFARIVGRNIDALIRFAERMLGSRAEAEDVVQDVFLRAWKQTPPRAARGIAAGAPVADRRSDMSPAMNLERFAVIVDAYGADPRRWPAAERDAAQTFVASDAQAAVLLTEALALDASLDALPTPEPAGAALRRAAMPLPITARSSRWQELLALLGGWRLALPAMAVALIVGVNVGSHADLSHWTADAATQTQTASASSNTLAAPGFAESLMLDLESSTP
ncbi:MAG: sigma factor [Nevskia sp.]|nr:sigma factor [Nevskia sp.]